tara:strand:+ start:375 stop:620 length:246 start_codon:yes stop_codon:yes gene_type:complete
MESTIREIVDNFFKEKKLDIISEVERKIVKECGRNFINKHISQITLKEKNIKVKTKTIEAKTEINLHKRKIQPKGYKIIIL